MERQTQTKRKGRQKQTDGAGVREGVVLQHRVSVTVRKKQALKEVNLVIWWISSDKKVVRSDPKAVKQTEGQRKRRKDDLYKGAPFCGLHNVSSTENRWTGRETVSNGKGITANYKT